MFFLQQKYNVDWHCFIFAMKLFRRVSENTLSCTKTLLKKYFEMQCFLCGELNFISISLSFAWVNDINAYAYLCIIWYKWFKMMWILDPLTWALELQSECNFSTWNKNEWQPCLKMSVFVNMGGWSQSMKGLNLRTYWPVKLSHSVIIII